MKFFSKAPQVKQRVGKLIVIDSATGELLEQQANLLMQACQFAGFDATIFYFPSKTSSGSHLIETYGDSETSTPYARAIFAATDRFEQKSIIRELLSKGNIVITTNYVLTNAAEQGKNIVDVNERISFFKWVYNLEHIAFEMPKPDLNVVVKEQASANANNYSINCYDELAKLYPKTKVVTFNGPATQTNQNNLHNTIWALVRRIVLRYAL